MSLLTALDGYLHIDRFSTKITFLLFIIGYSKIDQSSLISDDIWNGVMINATDKWRLVIANDQMNPKMSHILHKFLKESKHEAVRTN